MFYESLKDDVALAWFKNNNEIIHFDPSSGLLLEIDDSHKPIFNNISGRVSATDEFQNGPRISAVNKKWNPVLGSLNISNTKISDSGAYKCTTYTAKGNGF